MTKSDNKKSAFLFLFPTVLLFSVFVFYPLVNTLITSTFLTKATGTRTVFVGLDNYARLLHSSTFQTGFYATIVFLIMVVPITLIISLLLAILTTENFKGARLFRMLFSSTLGVSVAASSIFWLFIFSPSGYFNTILGYFHIPPLGWLTDPNMALLSVALSTIWMNIGFAYLILLGGMQSLPKNLYEASAIAGASKWTEFRKITLPMLSPTIYFVVTVSIINSFQTFGQIDLLTQGGPGNRTSLLVYQIYQDAFLNFNQGRASASAIILFILVMVVTLVQTKFSSGKVHYQQ